MILRSMSDAEPAIYAEKMMLALASRNPTEAKLLLSKEQITEISEEHCTECTGGNLFESRLQALLCPHLPILYSSPAVGEFTDCFTGSRISELIKEANLSGISNVENDY